MHENFIKAQDVFMEYSLRISHIFGLSEGMAQIVGFLYLSVEPVPMPQICKRLSLTKGTVSLYLRLLEDKKIISRCWYKKRGREKFYEINPHLWSDLKDLFLSNAIKRIEIGRGAVKECKDIIDNDAETYSKEDIVVYKLFQERIEKLKEINDLSEHFINRFLSNNDKSEVEKKIKKIKIE